MTARAPGNTVLDLTGSLMHAGHVLNTKLTAALAEAGISQREQCVLVHALQEERTQIQLAELAHLDKTTMVTTVDKLEKAGLAERRPSATDRRARIIEVTEAGRRTAEQGQEIVDRVHGEVLGAIPEAEREVFLSVLERLTSGALAQPEPAATGVRRARGSR
ncbi:Transcriptional regulator SlyA [Streptomyces sp. RB5]|uniref:Transcriptional regulator SlyA n=1 Tax=Streptomyces smaragdinus TaxID=2585196 RepID=A0A7K0CFD2_9ACTN|nr:MarR family transcriptional regulator [Streptomyces smaragdinus]MQY12177.1 Transcriptional regulator SlyA [Streptomyces smaragdinus]